MKFDVNSTNKLIREIYAGFNRVSNRNTMMSKNMTAVDYFNRRDTFLKASARWDLFCEIYENWASGDLGSEKSLYPVSFAHPHCSSLDG